MTDSDDENYVTFGVALDPVDEENLSRKKPVTIEDQYAYDAQGRRRFHGAFTGGFSAGYFNTVGTRDGWRPQQFKSSRSSKAESVAQRPEDFMDEEDTGQFGIAPKGIRATTDYEDHGQRGVKRERIRGSDGPIPGTPVLRELLKPVKETVGIMLLKKMGWKPGQGVGSRVTKKEKTKQKRRNEKIRAQHYPNEKVIPECPSDDSDDDCGDITFAPDDYEPFRCNPKDNYFGIGYSGLERRNILSGHVNLFDAPAFSVQEKNKKLSIHGQAFGVGAFEADDEDIYERDDMSRYDFALGPERKAKSRWSDAKSSRHQDDNYLEGFTPSKNKLERKKIFAAPELPKNFVPVHVVRKSRFYPPIENVPRTVENGKRKDLTAVDRARILEDTQNYKKPETQPNAVPSTASNIITRTLNLHGRQETKEREKLEEKAKAPSWMDKLNAKSFVKGGVVGSGEEGSLKKLEEFQNSSASDEPQTGTDKSQEASAKPSAAKPFLSDPDKQRRFEQYLELLKNGEGNKLESIQLLSMTEWDREHERAEFDQAARLFKQSASDVESKFTNAADSASSVARDDQESEMKEAARMKMFGKLTRERMEWKPASIVCKRFNIPEPRVGCAQLNTQKKSTKFSIFENLDWSAATKFSKATDTVNESQAFIQEKNIGNNLTDANQPGNDAFSSDQAAGPVSDKDRNFEASYEKVFGKEVQETLAAKPNEAKATQSTDVPLEPEVDSQVEASAESPEAAVAPRLASKSKSEEKKDLFKAIFLSSSEESDSEPEEGVDSEALKSLLIGKAASEVNVNRNTSPPRGIFAKLDFDSLISTAKDSTPVEETGERRKEIKPALEAGKVETDQNNEPEVKIVEPEITPDMYGPALPARLMRTEDSSTTEASGSQTLKPIFRSVVVPKIKSDAIGKWVERGKVKKSKKEKKKHKHKEHKSSKDKRKSKKERRSS